MKLAVMQPYFFPYLGYFHLLHACDRFVFYDDVNFIKSGWINRNRMLYEGAAKFFTVPLRGASSFQPINGVGIDETDPKWRKRMFETFRVAYRRAPHAAACLELLQRALESPGSGIASLARQSVRVVLEYLDLDRDVVESSAIYGNRELTGQDRVLDICRRDQARVYINPIGGMALYDPSAFEKLGIDLRFIKSELPEYPQSAPAFVAGLSILDIIANCTRETVLGMMGRYQLERGVAGAPAI